jgi:hypothetical protein
VDDGRYVTKDLEGEAGGGFEGPTNIFEGLVLGCVKQSNQCFLSFVLLKPNRGSVHEDGGGTCVIEDSHIRSEDVLGCNG